MGSEMCIRDRFEIVQHGVTHGAAAHLLRLATRSGVGTISPSSGVVRFVAVGCRKKPSVVELKSIKMSDRSPMDRSVVRKTTLQDQEDSGIIVNATPSERIGMVWQLTVDAWTFLDSNIAKSEFQRHVGRVERRES